MPCVERISAGDMGDDQPMDVVMPEIDLQEWHYRTLFLFEAKHNPSRRLMDDMLKMMRSFADKLPASSFCPSRHRLHKYFSAELLTSCNLQYRCANCLQEVAAGEKCENPTHVDGVGIYLYPDCTLELHRIIEGMFS